MGEALQPTPREGGSPPACRNMPASSRPKAASTSPLPTWATSAMIPASRTSRRDWRSAWRGLPRLEDARSRPQRTGMFQNRGKCRWLIRGRCRWTVGGFLKTTPSMGSLTQGCLVATTIKVRAMGTTTQDRAMVITNLLPLLQLLPMQDSPLHRLSLLLLCSPHLLQTNTPAIPTF